MKWTEKQESFLKKHFSKGSKEFLCKILQRSWDAIKNKAYSLNLKRDDGSSLIDELIDNLDEHVF